jgi:hypothetical protein
LAVKPFERWLPSQNGFVPEPPQRQSAMFSPLNVYGFPSQSVSVTVPVTK